MSTVLNPCLGFRDNAGGGTVSMPLEKQMWGDELGRPWMVDITGEQG